MGALSGDACAAGCRDACCALAPIACRHRALAFAVCCGSDASWKDDEQAESEGTR